MSIFRNQNFFPGAPALHVYFSGPETQLCWKKFKIHKGDLEIWIFQLFSRGGDESRGGGDENFKMCFFFEKNRGNVISGRNGVHLWKKFVAGGGGTVSRGGGTFFWKKRHFCFKYQIFFRHRTEKRTKKAFDHFEVGYRVSGHKITKKYFLNFFPKILWKWPKISIFQVTVCSQLLETTFFGFPMCHLP